MNNQFLKNNIDNININLNNTNKNLINMIQMNNSNNNILNYNLNNNPMNQMNNFQINQNPNINFQMINNNMNNNMNNNINNNMNNNINLPNQNPNNLINNPSLYNINIINYNNNMIDNNIFTKEKKNNSALLSYPIISERGVPGLYNLDSPKNIINIELLLKELNINFENKFDIVYLPQDYINNSNLGFGFINFVNPFHLVLFYEEFINKKWNFFNSKKRCNLAYSKYQGKNELIKYILTKLGISNLDNNSENIKKSFYIDNNKNLRAPIEIPINYYTYFLSYHRFASCHVKDSKVFIVDKYYNI